MIHMLFCSIPSCFIFFFLLSRWSLGQKLWICKGRCSEFSGFYQDFSTQFLIYWMLAWQQCERQGRGLLRTTHQSVSPRSSWNWRGWDHGLASTSPPSLQSAKMWSHYSNRGPHFLSPEAHLNHSWSYRFAGGGKCPGCSSAGVGERWR